MFIRMRENHTVKNFFHNLQRLTDKESNIYLGDGKTLNLSR
jgi:hypothetical protein